MTFLTEGILGEQKKAYGNFALKWDITGFQKGLLCIALLEWQMRDKTADFRVGQNCRFIIIQIASLC